MGLAGAEKSYTGLFFFLSQVFVLLTLYALYDEAIVRRPWKRYQEEFNALQVKAAARDAEAERLKFRAEGGEEKIKALEMEWEKAEIAKESDEYAELASRRKRLRIKYDDAELKIKFKKSVLDSLYYKYKHALQEGHAYAKEKEEYQRLEADIRARSAKLLKRKAKLGKIEDGLNAYDERIETLHGKIKELRLSVAEAEKRVENIQFRPVEIKQVVVEEFGKEGNIAWGRVDRCETCHVGSQKPGFEDVAKAFGLTVVKDKTARDKLVAEKPELRGFAVTERRRDYLRTMYGTHPRSEELFSKHPVERFGCTSCHGGEGRSVNIKGRVFGHGDKAHGYNHHAIEPLLRGAQVESSCLSCHNGRIALAGAKQLSKGAELFVELGCQNCHAVDGYDKLFRVGPELYGVGEKLRVEWLADWIKNPFNYMSNPRMPYLALSDNDVVAVASYLMANSEKRGGTDEPAPPGDAVRGERLFNTVGCTACHVVADPSATYAVRARAPHLSRIAAKVKNPRWIYDWIRDPGAYAGHTRMPDLRLSDGEAADVTAYLAGLGKEYTAEIYARSGEIARRVDANDAKLVASGKKVIFNRGCYSCHHVKGFEDADRIAPNLTTVGRKETFEFDFGDTLRPGYAFSDEFGRRVAVTRFKEKSAEPASEIHAKARERAKVRGTVAVTNIEETWQAWVRNKLRFPMMAYRHERVRLLMPNFRLSDGELDALMVFLKGLTGRRVPAAYDASLRDAALLAGERLVAEKNCLGCHVIGEYGGDILAKIDAVDGGEFGPMTQHYPPELTHVGVKIRSEWLTEYLKDPVLKYRPAVSVRMPSFGFGDDQVSTLVGYFSALSGVPLRLTDTEETLDPKLVAAGKTLASNESGLACFACHILDGALPGDDPSLWAPDWKLIRSRLKRDFVTKWIQDPGRYQKFAIMPQFLNTPDVALPGILDGAVEKQLEALRSYILSVGDPRPYKYLKNDYPTATAVEGF